MGASLASCFSRETPGEEPILEQTQPGFPGGDGAVPGEGPAVCNDPCECCYYTLGSKNVDGDYTRPGWLKYNGNDTWKHKYTWWHGTAAHGMKDRNSPDLGINKPGTHQCPCCYYRQTTEAGPGPGWYISWESGWREWKWKPKGALHWKPPAHWDSLEDLEDDRLDMPPPENLAPVNLALENVAADAPGSSTQGTWSPDDLVSVRIGNMYMCGVLMPPPPPPGSPPPMQGLPPPPPDRVLEMPEPLRFELEEPGLPTMRSMARILGEDMPGNLGNIE